jgi:hypothetical protein
VLFSSRLAPCLVAALLAVVEFRLLVAAIRVVTVRAAVALAFLVVPGPRLEDRDPLPMLGVRRIGVVVGADQTRIRD